MEIPNQVVVVGPLLEHVKMPGFAHFSKLVSTGSRSTTILLLASRSGGLIVI
jgi:hypothetical protein